MKVKSPLWRIMLDCADVINRIGGKFGLNPSDWAAVDTSDKTPQQHAERRRGWIGEEISRSVGRHT